ncbi:MAG: dihydroorotate dehydrogenase electron transfer subunit [Candidatus Omnitrophica bacterium]|nr:dihydroorotate dehydrogenase electron transfer subunit [Candidatus Omnitrophota bacterium]
MPILQNSVRIVSNRRLAQDHYRLRLERPRSFPEIEAGQFVQLRLEEGWDPFLPRPLCLYEHSRLWMDVVYQVVGRGTAILSKKKAGASVGVLGPLGLGFPILLDGDTYVFVAGGVGIASLYLAAKELVRQVKGRARFILLFGLKSVGMLHCHQDFRELGFELRIATDDGSYGKKGYVTGLVEQLFEKEQLGRVWVYACGPRPMFLALTGILPRFGQDAYLSLDEHMACGVGVCLGCAVKTVRGNGDPYRLVCKEGPVFKMSEIDWESKK